MLRNIVSPRWHGMGWDKFCVLADIGEFWSKRVEMHFLSSLSLFNTCRDTFWFLAGMGWVSSTHVEMHFVSSLALNGFDQFLFRCILRPRLHAISEYKFRCNLWPRLLVRVLLKHVEMHFVFSQAWDAFVHHKLRYILCHRWHGRGFVNICWAACSDLAGLGGVLVITCCLTYWILSVMRGVW